VCEVRARIVSGAEGGWGVGILSGSDAAKLDLRIMMNGEGKLTSRSPGVADAPWLSSPAIHPASEWNQVRVERKDARIRVFVNGVFLFERAHPRTTSAGGLCLFCFGAKAPVDVRIINLQVHLP